MLSALLDLREAGPHGVGTEDDVDEVGRRPLVRDAPNDSSSWRTTTSAIRIWFWRSASIAPRPTDGRVAT